MTKFTVGAQMYSVRTLLQTEEDMKAAFAQLKAMGYNEVQMSGYNFQIPPERIAALLEEAGRTRRPRTFPSIGWKKMWTAASRTTRR